MLVLLDQNVPRSVADVFRESGHDVILLGDVLPIDAPDPLVATVSELEGAVLVSHDGDFRNIAPRIPRGARARFSRLSRIHLQCPEPQSARRVREAMSFIEAEYEIASGSRDSRMILAIGKQVMRTHR